MGGGWDGVCWDESCSLGMGLRVSSSVAFCFWPGLGSATCFTHTVPESAFWGWAHTEVLSFLHDSVTCFSRPPTRHVSGICSAIGKMLCQEWVCKHAYPSVGILKHWFSFRETLNSKIQIGPCLSIPLVLTSLISFLLLLFFFLSCSRASCRILAPQPGINPRSLALGVRSLNHWTTGSFWFFLS